MSDAEWDSLAGEMDVFRDAIGAWPPASPDLEAVRCEQSRHRTLAHLRSAQETWLQACLAFHEREGISLRLPHPWRHFELEGYAAIPWADHLEAFMRDRSFGPNS